MHVTACLAGQKVDVEVGEDCRTLQALRESIVVALPQLCVEGFDVSVGGRFLDSDEGVVSLQEDVCLDVSANSRVLSVLALREAGLEASEAGLLNAAAEGDASLVTLFLDAGVPIDCIDADSRTPLFHSCCNAHLEIVTLLLDRGSATIDAQDRFRKTPLHGSCYHGHTEIAILLLDRGSTAMEEKDNHGFTLLHLSCIKGHAEIATLLLDRGSTAMDAKNKFDETPLHYACGSGHVEIATLLLDRGSAAIDAKDDSGRRPLHISCRNGHVEIARLLLDRGCFVAVEELRTGDPYSQEALRLLSERGHNV